MITASLLAILLLTQPPDPAPAPNESPPDAAAPAAKAAPAALPSTAALVEMADAEAMQIGQKLRCPVCQGMPIAESPSEMAQDMMSRIREKLAAGESEKEITDHFVSRYGEWVLLDPKREGLNWTLWILPVVALLLGAGLVFRYARRAAGAKPDAVAEATGGDDDDPYLAAIRKEVDS